MSSQPNHYETLGLPQTATAEQIKRKYRELARRYHPDVNSSSEATNKILNVNQAYHVLGDADRRAAYDAERALAQAAPRTVRPSSPSSTPSRPRRPAGRPAEPDGRVYYDGFGRSYAPKPDRRDTPPGAAPKPRQVPDRPTVSLEQILGEAKLAFINRQFTAAYKLCQEALNINPREATAHEIMGDIYLRQGDTQRASTSFSYSIQFNPRNHTAQVKLDRLMRAAPVASVGPTITFTRAGLGSAVRGRTPDAALAIVSMLAGGITVATPILLALFPGNAAADGLSWFFGVSYNLLAALAVAGMAGGVLLAFYGRMRPFTDEAWKTRRDDGSPLPAPLGAILMLFAAIWFYGSFLIYVGMAASKNRFSPSILKAYAVSLALVVVFSLAYRPSGLWTATLISGNVLFPSVLYGWFFGDALRLRGRM